MESYSDRFGIELDEATWEEDYKGVVRGLAAHLERLTGIALTGWDSPARGGIYVEGREERDDGHRMIVWMRPNFVPESGDWGMDNYKQYTVIASVFGTDLAQVSAFREAILSSRELGATLLHREIVRTAGRSEVLFSLKDSGTWN